MTSEEKNLVLDLIEEIYRKFRAEESLSKSQIAIEGLKEKLKLGSPEKND